MVLPWIPGLSMTACDSLSHLRTVVKSFPKERSVERNRLKYSQDLLAGIAFPIGVFHLRQAGLKFRRKCAMDPCFNRVSFVRSINDVRRPQPALLPVPNIYDGKFEQTGLHNPAA